LRISINERDRKGSKTGKITESASITVKNSEQEERILMDSQPEKDGKRLSAKSEIVQERLSLNETQAQLIESRSESEWDNYGDKSSLGISRRWRRINHKMEQYSWILSMNSRGKLGVCPKEGEEHS
jgi:hypothetical protein